jgi:ribosomal protein S18 acetylase RimI-like enzyme
VPGRLEPLESDREASRGFGRRAIEVRAQGSGEPARWVHAYEESLAAGSVNGRLYVVDGRPRGLVVWSPSGTMGLSVHLLYASMGFDSAEEYARVLSALEAEAGPVAFVSGPLSGLAPDAEDRLMRPLGFRRFGRSEMVLEASVAIADAPAERGERFRPVVRSDLPQLADLHRRAYREQFDRYLFLEDPDERQDALRSVREILDGRWGELVPAGSWIAERDGRSGGAVLSVGSPAGALVADVVVDPELQGVGLGRRLLTTALAALRGSGERRIYLNVTEGNERALRLYRRLGFVRSRGPTRDWYNARRIPVTPAPDA